MHDRLYYVIGWPTLRAFRSVGILAAGRKLPLLTVDAEQATSPIHYGFVKKIGKPSL
jgi:hypothetical protein